MEGEGFEQANRPIIICFLHQPLVKNTHRVKALKLHGVHKHPAKHAQTCTNMLRQYVKTRDAFLPSKDSFLARIRVQRNKMEKLTISGKTSVINFAFFMIFMATFLWVSLSKANFTSPQAPLTETEGRNGCVRETRVPSNLVLTLFPQWAQGSLRGGGGWETGPQRPGGCSQEDSYGQL